MLAGYFGIDRGLPFQPNAEHINLIYAIINIFFYLFSLACRCAEAAKSRGLTIFGIRDFGICHGAETVMTLDPQSSCIDGNFKKCDVDDKYTKCAGPHDSIFVYSFVESKFISYQI